MSWSDIVALIAIIAALVGFTLAGPGDVRTMAQAVFYICAVAFFIILIQRFRHRKPKEL
jgi:uncharacterized membrane protein YtjA (UPF0391 family)